MAIITTTSEQGLTFSPQIPIVKTKAYAITLRAVSLKPNSKYTFHVNNVDMSWATKQTGQRMGADIITDDKGQAEFSYLTEINPVDLVQTTVTKKYNLFHLKDIDTNIKASFLFDQTLIARR